MAGQSRTSGLAATSASPGGNLLSGLTRRNGAPHNKKMGSTQHLPTLSRTFNFVVLVVVVWSSLASAALASMDCDLSGSQFIYPGLATNLNGDPTLTDGDVRTITYVPFQMRDTTYYHEDRYRC